MNKRVSLLSLLALTGIAALSPPAQAAVTLSADTSRPTTSTFPLGEAVSVTFSAAGLSPDAHRTLKLTIKDEFGKVIQSINAPVTADQDGNAEYTYNAPAAKLGYYEISASLDGTQLDALGTRPAGIITYALVPDPAKRVDYGAAGSRFGMQGGFSTSAPVIPYLGIRYLLKSYVWARLEPKAPGQFVKDRAVASLAGKTYPDRLAAAENPLYDDKIWKTYIVGGVTNADMPSWASQPGTTGKICKSFGALNEQGKQSLPAFAAANAKAFAADYPDMSKRIYQITWEPAYDWCFGGKAEQLVEIYALSYNAIHQADPHAVVAGPTLFLEPHATQELKDLWAAGMGKYVDMLSLHPYVDWPPEKHDMIAILHEQLQDAEQAVGHKVPFIGTEHGYKSTEIGPLNKGEGDIRATLVMLGEGATLDTDFYIADFRAGDDASKTDGYGFYWNLNPRINYGTDKIGPKPGVPAYAAMTWLLDGSVSKGPLPDLQGTQMGYEFARGNTRIQAVWDYGDGSTYKVPPGATQCDWMGNCGKPKKPDINLTGAPVYFLLK